MVPCFRSAAASPATVPGMATAACPVPGTPSGKPSAAGAADR